MVMSVNSEHQCNFGAKNHASTLTLAHTTHSQQLVVEVDARRQACGGEHPPDVEGEDANER